VLPEPLREPTPLLVIEPTAPVDPPVPGVATLDHTADVGLVVEAPDQAELLRRAALGLAWLLTEAPPPRAAEDRRIDVEAEDAPSLLRAWLRQLLRWHEDDGFLPAEVEVLEVAAGHATARVAGGVPDAEPVREIKGVTFHDLAAERRGTGWWGRVVFDV
jgi:SHS2 domain-containing protein